MKKRAHSEPRLRPGKGNRLPGVPFLLACILTLAACQEDPPATTGGSREAALPTPVSEPELVTSHDAPVPPPEPRQEAAPLDLTLPQEPEQQVGSPPEDNEPAVLPDFFEPGKEDSSVLSGKVLFQDGEPEGVLDHISGAELEVSIPVD